MPTPLITIEEARRRVAAAVSSPLGTDTVPIERALDRILREEVIARHDAPPFSCSAMDGYAVGGPDAEPGPAREAAAATAPGPAPPAGSTPATYRIVGESRAGHPYGGDLTSGQAVRISTGAAVPPNAFAVLRQEDATVDGTSLTAHTSLTGGENIRHAAEDMRAGETILSPGLRLGPAALAAAIASGHGPTVTVARKPVVSVLATGDELRAAGAALEPGAIHNSNGPMLAMLAERAGATIGGDTQVADDPTATRAALQDALSASDVVLVAGGVSVGPHDLVKPALAALGVQERFWGVALQPGKPTWFGVLDRRLVFGLPGNPVSAAVTFSLFARPAIDALLGARAPRPLLHTATLAAPAPRSRERDRMIRVRLRQDGDRLLAEPTGPQESHLVTSLGAADALAFIPRGQGRLEAGEAVRLEPPPS